MEFEDDHVKKQPSMLSDCARDPRVFLAPGDVVRIAIDGLGEIEHAIGEPSR